MVDKKNKKEVIKQPKKEVKQTKKKDVKQPKKEVKQTKKNVKQPKKEEYIYNPDTKRNVKKNGDVGKKVLEKYGGATVSSSPVTFKCCRTDATQNKSNKYVASAAVSPAKKKKIHSFNCCPTINSTHGLSSNCFKTTNLLPIHNSQKTPNSQNGIHSCFKLDTSLYEKLVNENEIFQLYEDLNNLYQSNSVSIDEKYTISKTNANAKTAKTNANTQSFEITITPPPPTIPPNSTQSPSDGCDLNIKYDNNSNIVTITKIETEKCGIVDDKFFEKLAEIIKQILEEILTEFVNIFEKMTKVDVNGLVKGVFIAIIVDTIFEDLCKEGNSSKPLICKHPEIKILMNVTMNNLTATPIQIVAKTTIGMVKSSAELSTLQDMIRKFYVTNHFEQLKAMFNLQSQTNL